MKAVKYLIVLFICLNVMNAPAQTFKELLERTREKAKAKANAKLEEKTTQAMDKLLNAPETAIQKKKTKKEISAKGNVNAVESELPATEIKNTETVQQPLSVIEVTIKTDVKCSEGKDLLEELIRGKAGVSKVNIDTKTGNTYLQLTGEFASKEELEILIRNNGYEANGKKKIKGNNACK